MPRWSAEARKKQAMRIRQQQPWKHSTGPKSAAGKARSAMNAYKHGHFSAPAKQLRRLLHAQAHLLREMKQRVIHTRLCHPEGPAPEGSKILRFAQDDKEGTRPRTHPPYCRIAQIRLDFYPQFFPHLHPEGHFT